MKFFLFNSPIYKNSSDIIENYLPPLELGYIATHLLESCIDTHLIDCVSEYYGTKEIFNLLKKERPNYIGINIFTQNYEIVKNIFEKCPIKSTLIIGGQVVKHIYNKIIHWKVQNPMIIIIGEAELILPKIILKTCVEKPIITQNNIIVYKVDKNSAYFPQNLELVHLNRSIFKNDILINHYGQREAMIVTSRGCLYNCAFCGGAHNLNKSISIRFRNISSIENEISNIVNLSPDVTSIRILDDLFLRDQVSIDNAIKLFKKYSNLTWRGMAHILSFSKSFKKLFELKKSGCRELFIGIESGSNAIRKKINKLGTTEQVLEVIDALLKVGIDVKGYFIYGFPSETIIDANATFELALKLSEISKKTRGTLRLSVFQFRPYQGTQLYDEIIKTGEKISPIKCNANLNISNERLQFNFQSGNYSNINDKLLNNYILKTQNLQKA